MKMTRGGKSASHVVEVLSSEDSSEEEGMRDRLDREVKDHVAQKEKSGQDWSSACSTTYAWTKKSKRSSDGASRSYGGGGSRSPRIDGGEANPRYGRPIVVDLDPFTEQGTYRNPLANIPKKRFGDNKEVRYATEFPRVSAPTVKMEHGSEGTVVLAWSIIKTGGTPVSRWAVEYRRKGQNYKSGNMDPTLGWSCKKHTNNRTCDTTCSGFVTGVPYEFRVKPVAPNGTMGQESEPSKPFIIPGEVAVVPVPTLQASKTSIIETKKAAESKH